MITGVGLDLVDVRVFQDEIDEKREEWLERVFTVSEREYCERQPDPYRHFAGTFAAKEATLKALGTGWTDQTDLRNVEVIRTGERPQLALHGSVMEIIRRQRIMNQFVSITHTRDHAAAVVVLES
jgi:holo-[acyl-carrier protein] synthase